MRGAAANCACQIAVRVRGLTDVDRSMRARELELLAYLLDILVLNVIKMCSTKSSTTCAM